MAATTSTTTITNKSLACPASRKVVSHTFRPKFPLDPLAGTRYNSPWLLNVEALLSTALHAPRHVILVLGTPSFDELDTLLQSRHLSQSLVILATHTPPAIPPDILPALRILRLSTPLNEVAGAISFVNVLEWAERVARVWREYGGSGIAELSENDAGCDYKSAHRSSSAPARPVSLLEHLSDSRAGSERSSKILRPRPPSLPFADPTQRAFDAIINFLPDSVTDKTLLKQVIFTTGVAHPFLSARQGLSHSPSALPLSLSSPSTPSSVRSKRRSIFGALSAAGGRASIFTSPCGSKSDPSSVPPLSAHLVHLLPSSLPSTSALAKLTENIESFLLSFAYPAAPDPHAPEPARPYVMGACTFGTALSAGFGALGLASANEARWTVADAVLCGAFDGEVPAGGLREGLAARWGAAPRAWIADARDVVYVPSPASSWGDITPPPTAHVHALHTGALTAQTAIERQSLSAQDKGKERMPGPPEIMLSRGASAEGGLQQASPLTPSELSAAVCGMPRSPVVSSPTPPDSDDSGVESSASSVADGEKGKAVSGTRGGWKFWRVLA
ncbi:hypothetical protein SCP_0509420 [Sparassis crispa]|uniref:Uncharacterized protein n=1 Tax=Sparassis crispa TaxID=139825 RepID=A0A401GNT5_9APHY|nr:hypothetical protein SCP_0509420 [Sparassis crispa]GBE83885.1 hypothetical protein SCP_0509420 [Sparassis crispa]